MTAATINRQRVVSILGRVAALAERFPIFVAPWATLEVVHLRLDYGEDDSNTSSGALAVVEEAERLATIYEAPATAADIEQALREVKKVALEAKLGEDETAFMGYTVRELSRLLVLSTGGPLQDKDDHFVKAVRGGLPNVRRLHGLAP